MTTYTVQVLNESGYAKSYVFFTEPATVIGGGPIEVFTNAWVTFNSITTGGYDSVQFDETLFGYWGTTPDTLGPGTILRSGGTSEIDLSQQPEVPFDVSPTGFGVQTTGKASTGAYAIAATGSFTAANGFVFGMAKGAGTPIPAPTSTFVAQPSVTFQITPAWNFYVSDGAYTTGEVIDFSVLSVTAARISFDSVPQTTATVTQGADGRFLVQYS